MGSDGEIEARLQRWAQWVKVGDGSGYASVCTLHENWTPPTPGQAPALKVGRRPGDALATHQAIGRLNLKLRNAVVARYIYGGTVEEQAALMQCMPDTVRGRVQRAHAALMAEFCNNAVQG